MDINDGGPAFPIAEAFDERTGNVTQYASNGMSLRDYFAAKAMQGLLANPGCEYSPMNIEAVEQVTSDAYALADFMLKARDA
jgi:hypothetical protein